MGNKSLRKVRRRMATELLLSEIDFVKDKILNLNKLMITDCLNCNVKIKPVNIPGK